MQDNVYAKIHLNKTRRAFRSLKSHMQTLIFFFKLFVFLYMNTEAKATQKCNKTKSFLAILNIMKNERIRNILCSYI